jgi:nucleotide-binding universal stress UspA family protein
MELPMSYKSLLVHVQPSDAGRARLRTAVAIAKPFGARLIGLGARAFDPMPDPIGLSAVKLKEEIEHDLAAAEGIFKEETASLEDRACIWHRDIDFPTQALLRHACGADLILAERNVEASTRETQAGAADLIMGSGLPVLAIPADATPDFKRIIIGWKDTRETRRAISDALPLLKRAESVRVVQFGSEPAREIPDVVARLRMHGIQADGETRQSAESSAAEAILAAAEAIGAGLIVAGGYGHSRMREWALGGVTQGLLMHSPKPVLFSH